MKKEDLIALGLTEEQAQKVLDAMKDYVPNPDKPEKFFCIFSTFQVQ